SSHPSPTPHISPLSLHAALPISAMLDDLGLLPALRWHCERYTAQTGVRVSLEHAGLEQRFPADVETAAYRIVQEALTNVARHAGDRKSTRLNSSHVAISYAVFCF